MYTIVWSPQPNFESAPRDARMQIEEYSVGVGTPSWCAENVLKLGPFRNTS